MPHHVVGHIHFLVKLTLQEFLGEGSRELVGFNDALSVQQEYNLVATLGIVGMQVIFVEQIILQFFDVVKESCTIAIVEGMVHGIA